MQSDLPVTAGSNSEHVLSGPNAHANTLNRLDALILLSKSPAANSSFNSPTGLVAVKIRSIVPLVQGVVFDERSGKTDG
jgi:hypothetical protein